MSRQRRNETWRAYAKRTSNNKSNPNQNICVQRVAQYLGVDKMVRNLHKMTDLERAARIGGYTVRSRKSKVKGLSVGGARKICSKISEQETDKVIIGYMIGVPMHTLFLDPQGNTIVDTAPRQRDRRKMDWFKIVYR